MKKMKSRNLRCPDLSSVKSLLNPSTHHHKYFHVASSQAALPIAKINRRVVVRAPKSGFAYICFLIFLGRPFKVVGLHTLGTLGAGFWEAACGPQAENTACKECVLQDCFSTPKMKRVRLCFPQLYVSSGQACF